MCLYTIDSEIACFNHLKRSFSRNTTTDLVKQELIFVGNEHGKLIEFRNLILKVNFKYFSCFSYEFFKCYFIL